MAMHSAVKAAFVAGTFSLLAGLATGILGTSIHNQTVTVNVNGETVSVSQEEYRSMYEQLKSDYQTLQTEYETLKQQKTASANNSSTAKPSNQANSAYLVYQLEPYSSSNFQKIIDETMSMGGHAYNNGFRLGSPYLAGNAFYNLDGKYHELSGMIGYEDPSDSEDSTIEFYGDDVLLTAVVVKAKSLPESFFVDVSNVRKLEIRKKNNSIAKIDFAEVTLK